MLRRLGWLAVVVSCHASPVSERDPAVARPSAAAGIDEASLDRNVDPCVDFYQYACGGWLATATVPTGYSGVSRATDADIRTRARLQAILEGAPEQPLRDFYASCMDLAAIDRAGTAPIKSLLATTLGVTDARSWQAAVIALHKLGFSVLWSVNVAPDSKDATTNVLYIDAGGLELPSRDYYDDPELADKLEAYRRHADKILQLVGVPAANARRGADDIVQIETAIARRMKTPAEARDPAAAYHAVDVAWLTTSAKSIDWPQYWRELGVTSPGKIVAGTPAFFSNLDALRAQFTWTQWASYFTYHAVSSQSFSLGRAIDDEDVAFQEVLSGHVERPARGPRCAEETKFALGDLLGRRYVAQHVSQQTKQLAERYVDAITAAVTRDIQQLDWMSSSTKSYALVKLGRVARLIGYPERWKEYDFAIARDDFAGNELRRFASATRRELRRAGSLVERDRWFVNAFTLDAYFDRATNSLVLPAGILQEPMFEPGRSLAANLGAIGALIGHELTHGFDDQGAKFDDRGNLHDWWQPGERARFETKQKCLVDQYATFEALPGRFVNGQLTLGENIADLGGLKAAYGAYLALRGSDASDREFFIGFAQARCTKPSDAWTERALLSDTHAPARFRVNGSAMNLPAFADAFHCPVRAPMNPASRCEIW